MVLGAWFDYLQIDLWHLETQTLKIDFTHILNADD